MKTNNEKQTIQLAKKFARTLKNGDVVLLEGDLGAGKTTFVKGIARAFKIKQQIKSPTFVLIHPYDNFVHVDAYRVDKPADLINAGLLDYINHDHIVVIEWGEKIIPLFKKTRYTLIKFKYGKKENERIIQLRKKPRPRK